MKTFEQKIAETVNEKLNDGTVEKLVEQYIEKGVSDALKEVFSWSGEGRKLIGIPAEPLFRSPPVYHKTGFCFDGDC